MRRVSGKHDPKKKAGHLKITHKFVQEEVEGGSGKGEEIIVENTLLF